METSLYAVNTYCILHDVEYSFICSLRDEGLITITIRNDDEFIEEEQLHELEIYTRLHHELGINPEGIDAIRHLVNRLRSVQNELITLKNRLKLYEQENGEKNGTEF